MWSKVKIGQVYVSTDYSFFILDWNLNIKRQLMRWSIAQTNDIYTLKEEVKLMVNICHDYVYSDHYLF